MNQQFSTYKSKAPVFFVHIIIFLCLVMSSCGVPPPAATEPLVATEPPAATEPPTNVIVTLLYPGTSDSTEGIFISNATVQFQEQNQGISVDLQFISSADYLAILTTRLAAGESPDLAKLMFFDLFQFYRQGFLLSVEEVGGEIDDDFLSGALDSAQFNSLHYGLPQRRDSCAQAYNYLSIFNGSQHPKEALLLMDFLTQSAQQEQAYTDLQWYPTRISVYDVLGLNCSVNETIRLPEEVLQQVFDQIPERAQVLEPQLDGGIVLFQEATGVFENDELVGFGAPVWSPLSLDEAKAKLESTGLVIGVLFINNVPEYPSGDYAVKCYTESCMLVDPVGSEISFNLLISEELATPVEVPRVSVEPGSEIKCYYFLIWKRCSKVG